jgi:hypothetical protein
MSSKMMPQYQPSRPVNVYRKQGQGHSGQAQVTPLKPSGGDPRHVIVSVLNRDSGRRMLDLLQKESESFGLRWVGTLRSELEKAGVENAAAADELEHQFALLRIEGGGGSDVHALRELFRFECREGKKSGVGPFVAAEPDYPMRYSIATKIGSNYDLNAANSWHSDYCRILNVGGAHRAGLKGKDVTVAVVDSGVETTGIATDFQDLQDPTNTNETDDNGHGTAMASIIADVAPEATVHAIRISDGFPRMWMLMMGVAAASFEYAADIINLSLGLDSIPTSCSQCGTSSPGLSTNLEKYLNGIAKKAIGANGPPLLVASTGNEKSTSGYNYPATWDCTVAVGAVNYSMARSVFSNYETGGSHPAFFVMPGGDEDASGNSTEWIGKGSDAECLGTSPATAYASAMLALYYSQTSKLRQSDRRKFLSSVLGKCDKSFSFYDADQHGKGLLAYV